MRPGRNGGRLRTGGSNGGAGGRPTNEFRRRLFEAIDKQAPDVVRDIASGKPIVKMRVMVASVAPHLTCANCGENQLTPKSPEDAIAEISVEASASPKDRIAALEYGSKYAVGAIKEVSVEHVRERMKATLEVIRTHVSAEQLAAIVKDVQPLWQQ
jgi:hypothetical protein